MPADLTWLFTVPVLKFAIKVAVAVVAVFLGLQVIRWRRQGRSKNPLAKRVKNSRKPYVTDQKERDKVLKQGFNIKKVPQDLDAIFIGSGIGSLSAAALMAKAGKKVLVLEQHDQAGGCCHTFLDHGYEFDVGIHYVGQMGFPSPHKILLDQISDGQLEWAKMEEDFDQVSIGVGSANSRYPVRENHQEWKKVLRERFPEELNGIEQFFQALGTEGKGIKIAVFLKVLPVWISKILSWTGLASKMSSIVVGVNAKTTLQTIQEMTSNPDLQTIMCYCWGNYGTIPSCSGFAMQSSMQNHFQHGGFYPVGGASEIAFNIIPVIEESGGKVLVRAKVEKILYDGRKVMGVAVTKGSEAVTVEAPLVVSSAGLYNTFHTLLPKEVAVKSKLHQLCEELVPGLAGFSVFVGLDASNEELGLKSENIWHFASNQVVQNLFTDYLSLSKEQVLDADVPFMFVSFPSCKDPNWSKHPGRENKSTMVIVTLTSWRWYEQWKGTSLGKRGDEYEELKKTIGSRMIEQCRRLFPQIRDRIDFVDFGSPLSNTHYLASPHGEIYGLDHNLERFSADNCIKLRPKTDVRGLYLTGQDIVCNGLVGALYGGILAAGQILGRNLVVDLERMAKRAQQEDKKSD